MLRRLDVKEINVSHDDNIRDNTCSCIVYMNNIDVLACGHWITTLLLDVTNI